MVTQTNICVICFDPIGINKWKCNNCYGVLHRECIHKWKITNPIKIEKKTTKIQIKDQIDFILTK